MTCCKGRTWTLLGWADMEKVTIWRRRTSKSRKKYVSVHGALCVKGDFHCRVNFTSVTHVYLTGFTACAKRKSWTALNFYVKCKPFTLLYFIYVRKANQLLVRNRRKIYATVETHRKTEKLVSRGHLREYKNVRTGFQEICCYSKDNKETSIQWEYFVCWLYYFA